VTGDKPQQGDKSQQGDSPQPDDSTPEGGEDPERDGLEGAGSDAAAKATEAGTQLQGGGGGGGGKIEPGGSGKDWIGMSFDYAREKVAEMEQQQKEIAARNAEAERARRESAAQMKR
jgi:hypothetical protein